MSTSFYATLSVTVSVDLDDLGVSPDEIRADMGLEPWDKIEYKDLEQYIKDYWGAEDLMHNGTIEDSTVDKVEWK